MKSYTTYNPALRRYCKQFKMSFDEVIDGMIKKVLAEKNIDLQTKAFMRVIYVKLDREILEGRASHIFMPPIEFCNWLVGCVDKMTPEHAGIIQDYIGENVGVLHFPTGPNISSVAFWCPEKVSTIDDAGDQHHIEDHGVLVLNWGLGPINTAGTIFLNDADNGKKVTPDLLWYYKLVCGLGLYIAAFPGMMVNGYPFDLKHPAMHKNGGQVVTLDVEPRIRAAMGGHHASPECHLRSYHFRVLRSPKFTKKRFQVIPVKACVVGGRTVKTVLTPEEEAKA